MKKENAIQISEILGIDSPEDVSGGTLTKEWILSAVRQVPGCEEIDSKLTKSNLLKIAIEELGGSWGEECESEGGTVTTTALSRLAIGLEPRLEQMREIWALLGREGYPSIHHNNLISVLYTHYLGKEPEKGEKSNIFKILEMIDQDHGLSESELFEDDTPSSIAYQVILHDLHNVSIADDVIEEEEDEEVRKFVRTQVTATQVGTLARHHDNGILDLAPPWQRGDVWSPKKKKAVIESIMLGIPLPALILHKIERDGRIRRIEVIDGQQRLRAIMQYMDNRFPLAKFPSNPRHELVNESGCYWDHDTRKSLDKEWRAEIEMEEIPIMWFVNVKPKTLRKVFNLYNTAAMKLNAAEIRNATYQTHSLHQMAFILAGENTDSEVYYVDEEIQKDFTSDWRELGGNKRFASTELICQYYAYSRPQRPPNSSVFKGTSTAMSINRLLDNLEPSEEEIPELVQELIEVYYFAEDYFDLGGKHLSFERLDKDGNPKFNKLVTITNLVASRLLSRLRENDLIEEDAINPSIESVIRGVQFPDNQNAGTIWQYQADVINDLLEELGLSSEDPEVTSLFPNLVPCMNEIRRTE